MSRTISMPGVSVGTTNTDAWRCGRPSGLVSANTSTMSATDALVMNHLWPLMTHSSPSMHRGRADDRRVGAGEERLGERERARDLAAQVRPEPALLLRVGRAVREQLHVAAVGRLHAEDAHRHHAAADDLRHQRQLQLPEARRRRASGRGTRPRARVPSPGPAGAPARPATRRGGVGRRSVRAGSAACR